MTTPQRRTNVPQALKKSQVDDFKIAFGGVSSKQGNLKAAISQVLVQIFKTYKENGFKNDKNLKLYNTFLLLKNISQKDGEFVRTIKKHKDQVVEYINDIIKGLINVDGIGQEIYKEITSLSESQNKHYISNIQDIFRTVVEEFTKDIESDETKTDDSTNTLQKAIDFAKQINKHEINDTLEGKQFEQTGSTILTKNNIKTFKIQLFDGLLTAFKQYDNTKTKNIATQTQFIRQETKSGLFSNNIVKDQESIRLQQKIPDGEDAVAINIFSNKNRKSLFRRFSDGIYKTQEKASRIINKNLNQINVKIGRITVGLRISKSAGGITGIFSSGKASTTGVFTAIGTSMLRGGLFLFNIGAFVVKSMFNIGKFVIGGIVGFAKGIAKFTATTVKFVMSSIATPLLKGLLIAFKNPAGAFALGYISHMVINALYSPIKKLKDKIASSKFIQELKKRFDNRVSSIIKKLKNVKWQDIKKTLENAAQWLKSGKLVDYMTQLTQLFTMENLTKQALWAVAGSFVPNIGTILWKSLRLLWKGRGVIGKAASGAFKSGLKIIGSTIGAPVLTIGAMVGGFVWIIHSANKTMKLFNQNQNRRKSGENRFNARRRKTYADVNDTFRQGKYLNLFKIDDKSAQDMKSRGIDEKTLSIIQESIKSGVDNAETSKAMKKVIERIKQESPSIESEFNDIKTAISQHQKKLEDDKNTQMGLEASNTKIDVIVDENGKKKHIRDLLELGIDKNEFLKFRTLYVLIRSELVKQFSNGKIKTEDEYDKLVSEILVKKNGVWMINEKFTKGDFIQFKQHDENNFIQGRTVFGNDNYYGGKTVDFKQISNNVNNLEETLKYTYADQLDNSFVPIEAYVEEQQNMTEENREDDFKVLRILGLYCDYEVTTKYNNLNTKSSILGLSLQILFAKRTREVLTDIFKNKFKRDMINLDKIDNSKMESLRTMFDLLCRNPKYITQFRTVMRTVFGKDRLGLDNLQLILTKNPNAGDFYILDYGATVGNPYKKKTFTSMDEIGIQNVNSIPKSSRFRKRKEIPNDVNGDYPFKNSWVELIDTQYNPPYEAWAGIAARSNDDIAEIYEKQAQTAASKSRLIHQMQSGTSAYDANTKCQIVTGSSRNTIAYSLVWVKEAKEGGFWSGTSYATCETIQVHKFRYSEYYVNKFFRRAATEFGNFFAGYLAAFCEMGDKMKVQELKQEQVGQNTETGLFGVGSPMQNAMTEGTKLVQTLGEIYDEKNPNINEGAAAIHKTYKEQLERLQRTQETMIEQEKNTEEMRRIIEESKPKTQSEQKVQNSVALIEVEDKDESEIESKARAGKSSNQQKDLDFDELLRELEPGN